MVMNRETEKEDELVHLWQDIETFGAILKTYYSFRILTDIREPVMSYQVKQ